MYGSSYQGSFIFEVLIYVTRSYVPVVHISIEVFVVSMLSFDNFTVKEHLSLFKHYLSYFPLCYNH